MISSVSNMSSAMMMRSRGVQNNLPPPNKDAFKISDSDSNGLVSSTELESVIEGINEVTGASLKAEEALSIYDTDQDGGLSGMEMLDLLTDNGFRPPPGAGGESGGQSTISSTTGQAFTSYAKNSGEDLIQQLIDKLQSSGSSSSVDTTV